MPNNNPVFGEEYVVGTTTESTTQPPLTLTPETETKKEVSKPTGITELPSTSTGINSEAEKYGTGKPKRVITRGKIIDDNS